MSEMGFSLDQSVIVPLLDHFKGDVGKVVQEIL